jgi:hypothetical protein
VEERVNLQSRRALLRQFAPQYREASYAQKRVLLNVFALATGYHRRYGMWLLNHAEDMLHAPVYKRQRRYGPEVQHVLFLVWHAANRICAKRLMPFLPILIEALERHEHLQISEECRKQLLSMSASLSGSFICLSAQTESAWPLHHAIWNAAQAADPHPHIRRVE